MPSFHGTLASLVVVVVAAAAAAAAATAAATAGGGGSYVARDLCGETDKAYSGVASFSASGFAYALCSTGGLEANSSNRIARVPLDGFASAALQRLDLPTAGSPQLATLAVVGRGAFLLVQELLVGADGSPAGSAWTLLAIGGARLAVAASRAFPDDPLQALALLPTADPEVLLAGDGSLFRPIAWRQAAYRGGAGGLGAAGGRVVDLVDGVANGTAPGDILRGVAFLRRANGSVEYGAYSAVTVALAAAPAAPRLVRADDLAALGLAYAAWRGPAAGEFTLVTQQPPQHGKQGGVLLNRTVVPGGARLPSLSLPGGLGFAAPFENLGGYAEAADGTAFVVSGQAVARVPAGGGAPAAVVRAAGNDYFQANAGVTPQLPRVASGGRQFVTLCAGPGSADGTPGPVCVFSF